MLNKIFWIVILINYGAINYCVFAGRNFNDISLLSAAGLAIAMGNAPDEVKAVADRITLDVTQNGLAVAINKFLL